MKMNENAMQDWLDRYNPFLLKGDDGVIMSFNNKSDMYQDIITRMYKAYPGGYIDMVLFLKDTYEMGDREAEDEVKRWERRGFKNPQMVQWRPMEKCDKLALSEMVWWLSDYVETKFDAPQFELAVENFITNQMLF